MSETNEPRPEPSAGPDPVQPTVATSGEPAATASADREMVPTSSAGSEPSRAGSADGQADTESTDGPAADTESRGSQAAGTGSRGSQPARAGSTDGPAADAESRGSQAAGASAGSQAGTGSADGQATGDGSAGTEPIATDLSGVPVIGDYAAPAAAGTGGGRRRGRGRKVAVAAIAVVGLIATGLAVLQFSADDGAESPEAAVQAFFDAVDDEDALGVLETLSPTERDILVPSVRSLAEQLSTFDVTDKELDLQKVDGLDLQVKDLELKTRGLHPDVSAVEVSGGTIATSANFRDLPLGTALTGALEEEGGRDLDEPVSGSEELDLTLVTVKEGDGWHVSLLYSLAEAVREGSDSPVPDFGNGIPAKGAASPKAAVDEMVAAFNAEDYTRMIELTPPDSMAVLHDYGPQLLEAAEEEATQDEKAPASTARPGDEEAVEEDGGVITDDDGTTGSATGIDEDAEEEIVEGHRGETVDGDSFARLEDVTFGEPEGSGATRRLELKGYRLVESYDGIESTTVYDGDCITFEDEGITMDEGEDSTETWCATDPDGSAAGSDLIHGDVGFGAAMPVGPLAYSPGRTDVVVVERDGAWYVDPARTILDSLLLNLGELSPEQVDLMIESWVTLGDEDSYYASFVPEDYEDLCPGVEPPADGASYEERKEAGRRCDDVWTEQMDEEMAVAEEAEAGCWAMAEGPERTVCLDELGVDESAGPPPPPSPADDCWESDDEAEVESCIRASGDAAAIQDWDEITCYEHEEDAAIESCLRGVGDPTAVGEFHADACYDSDDDAAIEACLEGLLDKGEITPDLFNEFRCDAVYEEIEDVDEADAAYDRCLEEGAN